LTPCMTGSRGLFMVIEESGMQFEFPDNRTTVKFDEELFYKNCFNKFPKSKGVEVGGIILWLFL